MAIRNFAQTNEEQGPWGRGKIEIATLDQALRIPPGVSENEFFDHRNAASG